MNTQEIFYLALIFATVACGVLGIGLIWGRTSSVKQRMRTATASYASDVADEASSPWREAIIRVAVPVGKLAQPSDEGELGKFRARFVNAGFRHPAAPALFFAAKTSLALALPLLFMGVGQLLSWQFQGYTGPALLLIMAAIGYYLPNIVLGSMVRARQLNIFESFPDAIDLMIVCIEAGLSLDMAINRAARELALRSAELAEELNLLALDLRVGTSRERALRNFAARTGIEEITMFVAMLLQADRFGTSIGESMRIHAEELRLRRRLRAEEKAAKIPLKLLFPLIFCIFPALLLVLLGPAMIQIYRILIPTMSGVSG